MIQQRSHACPYLPQDSELRMSDFRDGILVCFSSNQGSRHVLIHVKASPKDIEDLVETGKSLKLCPYFGARNAIPLAEVCSLHPLEKPSHLNIRMYSLSCYPIITSYTMRHEKQWKSICKTKSSSLTKHTVNFCPFDRRGHSQKTVFQISPKIFYSFKT